jgi:hypothetical protein
VTQANIATTICVRGYTANVRPPAAFTGALKRLQIAQYGYADTDPSHTKRTTSSRSSSAAARPT